jgi:hypothetical protein
MEKLINKKYQQLKLLDIRKNSKQFNALANELLKLEKEYYNNLIAEQEKSKSKHSKIIAPDIDSVVMNQDITVINLISDNYMVSSNKDIYESSFVLPTDKLYRLIKPPKDTIKTNILIKKKSPLQDTRGNIPAGSYIDKDNRFNYKREKVKHTKAPKKKVYLEIVRKSKGKLKKKRYRITKEDYLLITNQLSGYNKAERINTRIKNTFYLQADKFRAITAYMESISLDYLYNEKIRSSVYCKSCSCNNRRKNTLSAFDNGLSCSNCGKQSLAVKHYRIRYYYINNFVRYELNELNGIISKQIETANGFAVIYKGAITPNYKE